MIGGKTVIQNNVEFEGTQKRIAYFSRLVANMRKVESPENFPCLASSYIAEIEKMNAEVIEYLKRYSCKMPTVETA